jgi:hypothetical protein
MKGDFCRFTFDPKKNYVGTLMQQGRVQLDADWNEQQAIDRYQHEIAVGDVIGPHGAPNDGAGFAISLAPGGNDLTISPGRIYVGGIRVDNDASEPVLLSNQPYLKLATVNYAGFVLPTQSGRYLVYLDVWERHITALEDPQILETALGGSDTTTRIQIVWQVKLTPQPVGNLTCADFGPDWHPTGLITNGTMSARTIDNDSSNPCILPLTAGYRGLENQLYRVEIHRSGVRDDANNHPTIKWSRDNASVATTVTIAGQVLTAHDLGRDEILGFAADQWVELIDQRMELTNHHGHLLQIDSINRNTREITIKAITPVPAVDTTGPVRLRRWDNIGPDASENGIQMTMTPVVLENGIEVVFSGGRYRSGDYWLITARTAINSETGSIEWPLDTNKKPISKSPDGIVHRYCPLALIDFNQATRIFTLVNNGDCRPHFPALTRIRAGDVSFDNNQCDANNLLTNAETVQQAIDGLCAQIQNNCTIIITPQSDLRDVFDRINAPDMTHVRICFQAGEYKVADPLIVGGSQNPKGHVMVNGFGGGTKLIVQNAETFLHFENCESVTVRDVYVEAKKVGSAGSNKHLRGALNFANCKEVSVQDCRIRCYSGPVQGATCITATQAQTTSQWTTLVRIRSCFLEVGIEQVGILVFNVDHTFIEDNQIAAVPQPKGILSKLLENREYRAIARRSLFSHIKYGGNPPKDIINMETVTYGGNRQAYFHTNPSLVGHWQDLIESLGPQPTTNGELRSRLKKAADYVLLSQDSLITVRLLNGALRRFKAFTDWRNAFRSQFRSVMAQGIVIAGSSSGGEARILNNTITGTLQGVHVGYSRTERTPGSAVWTLGIQLRGNRIQLMITPIISRHPEGIFVGNYSNELIVESNTISAAYSVSRSPQNLNPEGLKVYGVLGTLLLIRHNNIASIESAILAVPLNGPHRSVHRWLVADNLASGFTSNVDIPASIDQIGNQPGGLTYTDLVRMIERLNNNG